MPKDPLILKSSTDKKELVRTAAEFAASDQSADIHTLVTFLSSEEFLNRLDSADDYNQPPLRLRLAKVLRTLMDNPKPAAAHAGLVSLTTEAPFIALEPRQELLVRALVAVRPAPPKAVQYWDSHSHPDSTWRHVVMDVLCDNGSEPAVDLLEKKLVDPLMDPDEKIVWMRDPILRHRLDVPLLKVCRRMVISTLEPRFKPVLVEALFDYRPDEWYVDCTNPSPPDPATASKEAKELLVEIGDHALDAYHKIALEPRTRAVIEAKLKLIRPRP